MRTKNYLIVILLAIGFTAYGQKNFVLNPSDFKAYIDKFNEQDNELYKQYISNDSAWHFLENNIPFLDCPDKNIELTYYFRWWTYRKHIKSTPDGYIITEFLPKVAWAGKYNSINCAASFHFYEGRWLKNNKFLNDYGNFWLKKGGNPRSYSFWIADAFWAYYTVKTDTSFVTGLLPDLVDNYRQWEIGRMFQNKFIGKNPDGLFSTVDDRDAMEVSIGGNGKRPTINSYMFGDAQAISKIAHLAGNKQLELLYVAKADTIRRLVLKNLWDKKANFFKTLPYNQKKLVDIREILGYTPWYFNLPLPNAGYEKAWEFIKSDNYFYAPYGLTTAERNHPKFEISYEGHECKWNGPSWPYSTSVTLTAMANVLNSYAQKSINTDDYYKQIQNFANAHRRVDEKGNILPWIDEDQNPFTGDWISRTMLKQLGWQQKKGGEERGKDYNHSTFCDLIISGLIGVRPQADETVIINPLVPAGVWDWYCLDNVYYHGKVLTIVYDKYGNKYNKGTGLMCFVDGKLKGQANSLQKVTISLK